MPSTPTRPSSTIDLAPPAGAPPSVLVLGAGGMLGHRIVLALRDRLPVVWSTLRDPDGATARLPLFAGRDDVRLGVDAGDLEALGRLLDELRPDVLVNCVGVIKQRASAKLALPSVTLNALLPHWLAARQERWGGRLIHFGTDCVFSGRRGDYREDDIPDPPDLYGRSKLLGEVGTDNALTLRTSIIGRELQHHGSLLDWFLQQRGRSVRGFRRAWWSGVTTNHLAEVVADLVERRVPLTGVYQVSSGRISKHDLLLLVRDAYGLDVQVDPDDDFFCDRSLDGSRFAADAGYRCPPMPALVAQLAADPTPYEQWLPSFPPRA